MVHQPPSDQKNVKEIPSTPGMKTSYAWQLVVLVLATFVFAGWAAWPYVLNRTRFARRPPENLTSPPPKANAASAEPALSGWCGEMQRSFAAFHWDLNPCAKTQWQVGGYSVEHRPLVFAEFGDPLAPNTTLILSAVHGDEITPVYLAFRLGAWMQEALDQDPKEAALRRRVILAPLINPDGFLVQPRRRVNAHGVDVNRNFATRDWRSMPQVNARRFPGKEPRSEPETHFQEHLIRHYRPNKILSIHSPLHRWDYDGPGTVTLAHFPHRYVQACRQLQNQLRASSSGHFPGSLGNFAGRELGIPTLTLELPTANPARAQLYWREFHQGILTMIQFDLHSPRVALHPV